MSRFSKQAELYARYRPEYPREMYDFIFKHLSSRHFAWDCATGSGQVAKYLADYFEKVYATDISQEQLSFAPQRNNIEYLDTSAENSGLPSNQCDLITVAQAIHWFNFEQFYKEVRRVGKNGSLLAVIGYGMVRISDKLDPFIDDLYEEAFSSHFNKNRKYIDEQYRTIPFPFEEIPSPLFQNQYNWSLRELEGYFNSWSAIQKIKSEKGYNPVDDTISLLKKRIPDPQNLKVTFPVFMRLGKVKS